MPARRRRWNNHTQTDLYMAMMKTTAKLLKEEYIGTHQSSEERTLDTLLEFYRMKFEQPRELQAYEDKATYEDFRRGNMKLKDAREKWQMLRARALAGGELQATKHDHKALLRQMQLGTQMDAAVNQQLEMRERMPDIRTHKDSWDPLTEMVDILGHYELAWQKADFERELQHHGKRRDTAMVMGDQTWDAVGGRAERAPSAPPESREKRDRQRAQSAPPGKERQRMGWKPKCWNGDKCHNPACDRFHPAGEKRAGLQGERGPGTAPKVLLTGSYGGKGKGLAGKGEGHSMEAKGRGKGKDHRVAWEDDWMCTKSGCGFKVFGKHAFCPKCGQAKPK